MANLLFIVTACVAAVANAGRVETWRMGLVSTRVLRVGVSTTDEWSRRRKQSSCVPSTSLQQWRAIRGDAFRWGAGFGCIR